MDKVHGIEKKPWICKEKIPLKKVVQERHNQLTHNQVLINDDSFTLENEKKLLEETEKFVKANESQVKPFFLFNSTDERCLVENPKCKLKSFELQLEHARKMISDRAYKVAYLSRLKTTRRDLLMRHLAQSNRSIVEHPSIDTTIPTTSTTALVVVQIWPQPSKSTKVRLEKEILFKSDQCLTELRDQFKCQRDYGVPMDLSENPEQEERIFRGELFKSGFFLIGDTFYNDMRDQNNIDLSSSIVDWAAKEVLTIGEEGENVRVNRGIGPFKRSKMEECKFDDLEFRLGCPYLYLHQGDCEHLFTISDIRYVSNNSNLQKTRFPYVTAKSIGRKDNLRCYMCKNRPPHWYTRNNPRLPIDPYFFCENCFYSFNYDRDKKKIGQFQAFLYTSTFGIPECVVMAADK